MVMSEVREEVCSGLGIDINSDIWNETVTTVAGLKAKFVGCDMAKFVMGLRDSKFLCPINWVVTDLTENLEGMSSGYVDLVFDPSLDPASIEFSNQLKKLDIPHGPGIAMVGYTLVNTTQIYWDNIPNSQVCYLLEKLVRIGREISKLRFN